MMKKSFINNVIKSLFTSAIAISSFTAPISVLAQDYEALIYGSEIEIEGLNQQQAQLYAELAATYAEVNSLNEKANELLLDLSSDDKVIADLQAQISELEAVISKRQELLAEQARAVQVTGGSSNYLNYVASSKDVSDFVGRVDVVRKMVDANKDLLEVQISDKEAVESKQAEVERAKEEKIVKMIDLESLKASLETTLAEQEGVYERLTNDLTLAQANRNALIEEKEAFEQAQILAAEEAAMVAAQAEAEAQALAFAQEEVSVVAETETVETTQSVILPEAIEESTSFEETQVSEVEEIVETTEVVAEEVIETTEALVEEVVETTEYHETTVAQVEEFIETTETVEEEVIQGPVGPITVETPNQAELDRIAAEEAAQAEADRIAAEEAAQAEADRIAAEEAAQAEVAQPAAPSGDLLSNASKYLGTPYVWGGKSPSGFDCSGFVQYVFKETYGMDIGGWTGAQENIGTRISVAEAQPGDLYFWGAPGATYHVAIATGGGNYIHASQPGTPLEYNSTQWFTPQFAVRVN